jgi:hypothetical protein
MDYGASGIGKKFSLYGVFFGGVFFGEFFSTLFAPGIPAVLYPGPGLIVYIYKILIVKVNFGEIAPNQCPLLVRKSAACGKLLPQKVNRTVIASRSVLL